MVTQLRREFYKQFCTEGVDLLSELDRFLEEPLRYYNIDVVDLFIKALGNAFEVNIIIFQSNAEQCWIINLSNESDEFSDTLHFARTESLHIDPVLRKTGGANSKVINDRLLNYDKLVGELIESDSDIEITGFMDTPTLETEGMVPFPFSTF